MSKIYVVTSDRRINLILHHGKFSKMNDAMKKGKKLKKEGKKYVAIKSYEKGGLLSHEKYV